MLKSRIFFGLFAVLALVFSFSPAGAEELSQNFSHSLSIGNSSKSFEHRIDLPDEWSAKGKFFTGRELSLDGKLVIEREELAKTYYYVKVRLPKATLWFAKGSINITLKAENTPVAPVLGAPDGLKVQGGYYPVFNWNGSGDYSAISLLDRSNGKTMWERVILRSHKCELDEGSVKIGGKYTWAVSQSDSSGRYSKESQNSFRVDSKEERCRQCYGHGYITCRYCHGSGHIVGTGPNNTPVTQICHQCNGTGRERCMDCNGMGYVIVPLIIQESRDDNSEKSTSESRKTFDGRIKAIKLSTDNSNMQGTITVANEFTEKTFVVKDYTLILISKDGKARVGLLEHLKPDWKCSIGYDIPPEDENTDFASDCENEIEFAENMWVEYQP